ncbi:MAG: hypothetical protein ABJB61_07550, partial [bacterium]
MPKKLRIKAPVTPALVINRAAIKGDRLVYLAVANKRMKHPFGSSRIVYIGTTKAGASRIAASAAAKASQMLALHGVKELEFYVVTCGSRKRVKTWTKLERGLILTFRQQFGAIPNCNLQGKRMKWTDELNYFTERRLRDVIARFS